MLKVQSRGKDVGNHVTLNMLEISILERTSITVAPLTKFPIKKIVHLLLYPVSFERRFTEDFARIHG